jgi:hypothetical protein
MHIQFRTRTFYNRPKEQLQERLHPKKSATSLSTAIRPSSSPLGPRTERDLVTDLYSDSTPIAIMDESDRQISFNLLNKSVTSLSAVIGASGSPLGPHPERDLATNLYSGSTLIVIMDESNYLISFNLLNKSTISLLVVIEASGSPLGPRPERDLAIDLYSGSTPIAIKNESNRRISFR